MARYSIDEKRLVHAEMETILDRLDAMGRQPDSWEETCLVHALSYMESGIYERALAELGNCILPVAERSAWRAAQLDRNPPRHRIDRLRMRLNHLKAEARHL